ncbi:copper chaperone PCu(A)C [Xanthomonas campestris]|uniref:Copper chaperone PCu(A)C n=1 Tax=Xanthomonas campestris pv. papavericola TaxID=487881 RepID=A0AAJ2X6L6_XANCA|nr:copper chaperone PCu(A)C [Xanthomonas campestris]MEC3889705.1 copper chaperone PCu(A)C [Xanthomonas campestris pv. papavericola]
MSTRLLLLVAISALTLAACKGTQAPDAAQSPATPAATADARAPATPPATAPTTAAASVVAENAWSRATPPGAPVAGGYVTLRNQSSTPDRLVAVESPASAQVELHDMRMDGGVMKMRRLDDGLALPPGETVVLGPGGTHLMFIGPHAPFEVGKPVMATLVFEHAPRVELRFDVRAMGAAAPDDDHHHAGHMQ